MNKNNKNKSIFDIEYVLAALEKNYKISQAPSVTLIAERTKDPFNILVSTIISLRTKDETTIKVSRILFEEVKNFNDILKLSDERLEKLLYPAGFYKTKAKRLKQMGTIINEKYDGRVPDDIDELLTLPGVGRKTANLVVIMGFNKPGLCVDTHVHRISNRFGWVKTKTPEQTEYALREFLPAEYWRVINDYLVSYGQTVCKPISPLCSSCNLESVCPKLNVFKHR